MAKADLIKLVDELIGEHDPDLDGEYDPDSPWEGGAVTRHVCGDHKEPMPNCLRCFRYQELTVVGLRCILDNADTVWLDRIAPLLADVREELSDAET